ncbi:hypothetical protein [Nocardioides sp. MH1]|uniref:hypothetical protein n=1 Tax=Nocardioides sp. MH1 TaxID=3242490 RepID=UPI003520D8AA
MLVAAVMTLDLVVLNLLGVLNGVIVAGLATGGATIGLAGSALQHDAWAGRTGAKVLGLTLLATVPVGLGFMTRAHPDDTSKKIPADTMNLAADPDVIGISGGCEPFAVWGQNRWEPYGAKILARPLREARQVGGVAPNKTVYVDGWVRTEDGNLTNRPPWNSNIWFHLADGTGWVSFAGTRGAPTTHDPTGGFSDDGGTPPPHPDACRAALR